ncbi:unnamed protein product [Amoebophrya sp. A120]|nr:unnamed protein product [Amoebophrya sp. A120]|eukprot:GSA120T00016915001.1
MRDYEKGFASGVTMVRTEQFAQFAREEQFRLRPSSDHHHAAQRADKITSPAPHEVNPFAGFRDVLSAGPIRPEKPIPGSSSTPRAAAPSSLYSSSRTSSSSPPASPAPKLRVIVEKFQANTKNSRLALAWSKYVFERTQALAAEFLQDKIEAPVLAELHALAAVGERIGNEENAFLPEDVLGRKTSKKVDPAHFTGVQGLPKVLESELWPDAFFGSPGYEEKKKKSLPRIKESEAYRLLHNAVENNKNSMEDKYSANGKIDEKTTSTRSTSDVETILSVVKEEAVAARDLLQTPILILTEDETLSVLVQLNVEAVEWQKRWKRRQNSKRHKQVQEKSANKDPASSTFAHPTYSGPAELRDASAIAAPFVSEDDEDFRGSFLRILSATHKEKDFTADPLQTAIEPRSSTCSKAEGAQLHKTASSSSDTSTTRGKNQDHSKQQQEQGLDQWRPLWPEFAKDLPFTPLPGVPPLPVGGGVIDGRATSSASSTTGNTKTAPYIFTWPETYNNPGILVEGGFFAETAGAEAAGAASQVKHKKTPLKTAYDQRRYAQDTYDKMMNPDEVEGTTTAASNGDEQKSTTASSARDEMSREERKIEPWRQVPKPLRQPVTPRVLIQCKQQIPDWCIGSKTDLLPTSQTFRLAIEARCISTSGEHVANQCDRWARMGADGALLSLDDLLNEMIDKTNAVGAKFNPIDGDPQDKTVCRKFRPTEDAAEQEVQPEGTNTKNKHVGRMKNMILLVESLFKGANKPWKHTPPSASEAERERNQIVQEKALMEILLDELLLPKIFVLEEQSSSTSTTGGATATGAASHTDLHQMLKMRNYKKERAQWIRMFRLFRKELVWPLFAAALRFKDLCIDRRVFRVVLVEVLERVLRILPEDEKTQAEEQDGGRMNIEEVEPASPSLVLSRLQSRDEARADAAVVHQDEYEETQVSASHDTPGPLSDDADYHADSLVKNFRRLSLVGHGPETITTAADPEEQNQQTSAHFLDTFPGRPSGSRGTGTTSSQHRKLHSDVHEDWSLGEQHPDAPRGATTTMNRAEEHTAKLAFDNLHKLFTADTVQDILASSFFNAASAPPQRAPVAPVVGAGHDNSVKAAAAISSDLMQKLVDALPPSAVTETRNKLAIEEQTAGGHTMNKEKTSGSTSTSARSSRASSSSEMLTHPSGSAIPGAASPPDGYERVADLANVKDEELKTAVNSWIRMEETVDKKKSILEGDFSVNDNDPNFLVGENKQDSSAAHLSHVLLPEYVTSDRSAPQLQLDFAVKEKDRKTGEAVKGKKAAAGREVRIFINSRSTARAAYAFHKGVTKKVGREEKEKFNAVVNAVLFSPSAASAGTTGTTSPEDKVAANSPPSSSSQEHQELASIRNTLTKWHNKRHTKYQKEREKLEDKFENKPIDFGERVEELSARLIAGAIVFSLETAGRAPAYGKVWMDAFRGLSRVYCSKKDWAFFNKIKGLGASQQDNSGSASSAEASAQRTSAGASTPNSEALQRLSEEEIHKEAAHNLEQVDAALSLAQVIATHADPREVAHDTFSSILHISAPVIAAEQMKMMKISGAGTSTKERKNGQEGTTSGTSTSFSDSCSGSSSSAACNKVSWNEWWWSKVFGDRNGGETTTTAPAPPPPDAPQSPPQSLADFNLRSVLNAYYIQADAAWFAAIVEKNWDLKLNTMETRKLVLLWQRQSSEFLHQPIYSEYDSVRKQRRIDFLWDFQEALGLVVRHMVHTRKQVPDSSVGDDAPKKSDAPGPDGAASGTTTSIAGTGSASSTSSIRDENSKDQRRRSSTSSGGTASEDAKSSQSSSKMKPPGGAAEMKNKGSSKSFLSEKLSEIEKEVVKSWTVGNEWWTAVIVASRVVEYTTAFLAVARANPEDFGANEAGAALLEGPFAQLAVDTGIIFRDLLGDPRCPVAGGGDDRSQTGTTTSKPRKNTRVQFSQSCLTSHLSTALLGRLNGGRLKWYPSPQFVWETMNFMVTVASKYENGILKKFFDQGIALNQRSLFSIEASYLTPLVLHDQRRFISPGMEIAPSHRLCYKKTGSVEMFYKRASQWGGPWTRCLDTTEIGTIIEKIPWRNFQKQHFCQHYPCLWNREDANKLHNEVEENNRQFLAQSASASLRTIFPARELEVVRVLFKDNRREGDADNTVLEVFLLDPDIRIHSTPVEASSNFFLTSLDRQIKELAKAVKHGTRVPKPQVFPPEMADQAEQDGQFINDAQERLQRARKVALQVLDQRHAGAAHVVEQQALEQDSPDEIMAMRSGGSSTHAGAQQAQQNKLASVPASDNDEQHHQTKTLLETYTIAYESTITSLSHSGNPIALSFLSDKRNLQKKPIGLRELQSMFRDPLVITLRSEFVEQISKHLKKPLKIVDAYITRIGIKATLEVLGKIKVPQEYETAVYFKQPWPPYLARG